MYIYYIYGKSLLTYPLLSIVFYRINSKKTGESTEPMGPWLGVSARGAVGIVVTCDDGANCRRKP